MKKLGKFICVLGLTCLVINNVSAQNEEQSELSAIQSEIKALDKKISETEKQIGNEKETLQDIEKDINATQQHYDELEAEIEKSSNDIKDLELRLETERKKVEDQLAVLEKIIIASYKEINAPLIKILLSQDDPELLDRLQQYYAYYSKSQADYIETQRQEIAEYIKVKEQLMAQQSALDKAIKEQSELAVKLDAQRKQREKNIADLDSSLSNDANKKNRLELDEQRLKKLVKELQLQAQRRALAAKKAAEEKAAQKRAAKEQAAREQAARVKAARARAEELRRQQDTQQSINRQTQQPNSAANSTPFLGSSNYPNDANKQIVIQQEKPKPEPKTSNTGIGKLKGQLPYPVNGQIVAKFGSPKQGSGLLWNGLMIKVNQGTPVQSIAQGEVVFADWFKGFGQMVVVDHGKGYMSLYSHNNQIVKRVGDSVGQNDILAYSGNSGGLPYNALYFEIRYNGQPVNPFSWLR